MPSLMRPPRLPELLEQKLTKAGYTRGASNKEIFQNRVTRNNTVLIDHEYWEACRDPGDGAGVYENGAIALILPGWYFETHDADAVLAGQGLEVGRNALLLFKRRGEWQRYGHGRTTLPSGRPFRPGQTRESPLGGVYIARVHATVAGDSGKEVVHGYDSTAMRGAGIRVYEYASTQSIRQTKLQLEALVWLCRDSLKALRLAGMTSRDAERRKAETLVAAQSEGLLDANRLNTVRILNRENETVCPLCLEPLSAADFMRRGEQAVGRETYDITITELSLFHIQELRVGRLQHKPYNLGWGHHFCNVVVKDAGILPTLDWMRGVLANQEASGHGDLDAERSSVEKAVDG